MTIYDTLLLFSAATGRVYKEEHEHFQPHSQRKMKRPQLPAYHGPW